MFAQGPAGRADAIAFGLLLLFIATATLPHGGLIRGGRLGIELAAFGIAGVAFLAKSSRRPLKAVRIPVVAILAIAGLGVIQLVPIPGGLLRSIAQTNATIYHETNEILAIYGRIDGLRPRISIGPVQTAEVVRLCLAYLAIFLAAAQILSSRVRRRLFALVLLLTAIIHIVVASSLQALEARLHGAFVNPNHLAAYLEIALAVAFGGLWAEVLVNRERARGLDERAERLERRFLPLSLRVLAWAIIATGIAMTQSRGGIAAAVITTFVLLITGLAHPRIRAHRRSAAQGAFALAAGLLLVVAIARGVPLLRFLASDSRDLQGGLRLPIWKTSVEAWKQFPLVGSGLGTFPEAFRRVQPREFNSLVERAHSDALQLLVTGGAVGAAFGVVLYGSLFVLLLERWKSQRHREESAMVLAGFGALFSLSLHGLVEYTMSIPAIPAVLACVLGMAWAAGSTPAGVRSP